MRQPYWRPRKRGLSDVRGGIDQVSVSGLTDSELQHVPGIPEGKTGVCFRGRPQEIRVALLVNHSSEVYQDEWGAHNESAKILTGINRPLRRRDIPGHRRVADNWEQDESLFVQGVGLGELCILLDEAHQSPKSQFEDQLERAW
jgi:hypothetical protein